MSGGSVWTDKQGSTKTVVDFVAEKARKLWVGGLFHGKFRVFSSFQANCTPSSRHSGRSSEPKKPIALALVASLATNTIAVSGDWLVASCHFGCQGVEPSEHKKDAELGRLREPSAFSADCKFTVVAPGARMGE